VGAQRATIAAIYLETTMKGVVDIKVYDTRRRTPYIDLAAGRLDAVLGDTLVNYEMAAVRNRQGLRFLPARRSTAATKSASPCAKARISCASS